MRNNGFLRAGTVTSHASFYTYLKVHPSYDFTGEIPARQTPGSERQFQCSCLILVGFSPERLL